MSGGSPSFWTTRRTMESSWRSNAPSRWSGVSSGLALARALSIAADTACCVLFVHLFGSNAISQSPVVENLIASVSTSVERHSERPEKARSPRAARYRSWAPSRSAGGGLLHRGLLAPADHGLAEGHEVAAMTPFGLGHLAHRVGPDAVQLGPHVGQLLLQRQDPLDPRQVQPVLGQFGDALEPM